jgi:phage-related tail protein
MTTTKRQRGRPAGTGKKDETLLSQVAALLVRAEASGTRLTPTMAMNQALRARKDVESSHQSAVRRLQRKWCEQSVELMAAARGKETERNAPRQTVDAGSFTSATRRVADIYGDYGTASRRLAEMANGHMSASRRLAEMAGSYSDPLKAIERALSPASEVFRQMDEMNQRMQDLVDPPALRRIGEFDNVIDRLCKPLSRFK